MKERVTITIETQLILATEKAIDGDRYKNRSHFIESALRARHLAIVCRTRQQIADAIKAVKPGQAIIFEP